MADTLALIVTPTARAIAATIAKTLRTLRSIALLSSRRVLVARLRGRRSQVHAHHALYAGQRSLVIRQLAVVVDFVIQDCREISYNAEEVHCANLIGRHRGLQCQR